MNGIWQETIAFPQHSELETWRLLWVDICDNAQPVHNHVRLSASDLDARGVPILLHNGPEENLSPTANAGTDQAITDTYGNGQMEVHLDGSGSDDPDGDIISWTWTESETQIATGETPTVSLSVGEHTITLTVTDNEGATDTDTLIVIVQGSHGFLTGRVIEVDTGNGLEATLDIEELGLCYDTEADGSFSLQLPQGTYTITVFAEQHDPRTRTCEIQAGGTTTLNFGVFLSPLWRREIQVGDILYDPRALGSLGHTGIYIGWGQTADPGPTTVVHHISTWDYPARNEVRILRVDAPLSIRSEAAWWAWDLGHRLDSSGLYKYQWQYINKNPDAESNRWYCSELVWAAYWNQGINIEEYEGIPLSLAELLIRPVSPDDVCEDDDTITVGGHCRGVVDTAATGCCGPLCGCPIVEIAGGLLFELACPADLEVIDPLGRSLGPTSSEIPGVVYMLNNEKREGEKYDVVAIANPIGGSYKIHVIPEPGASPNDTYTLSVKDTASSAPTTLADDVPIADIPAEGYEVEAPSIETPSIFRVDEHGCVYADQTFYAPAFETGAADVAEWVHMSTPAEPGDVVELDPLAPQRYRITQSPFSSLVAGVISTTPGVTLGTGLDASEKALLALVGIVPVKVTDEGGAIQPGDLLVTSSTPGHAMRWAGSEPCFCSLVGKALEPMDEEQGVILVLLTAH